MNGVQIRIRGKVQGVGFRPFVWQLARAQARCGEDAQTIPSGVHGGEQGDELLLLRYNGMAG